ncbi:MAG: ADP-ribosylglycohydrolase family protein, partial [Bacteroidota bacterium]
MTHPIRNALLGLVVGDALGVPVEFQNRETLKEHPLTDMTGYGTYNQPPGTWSDDSSLALCLADELSREFNLQNIADSFVSWLYDNHWTPYGEVFDVGNTTEKAIHRLEGEVPPELSGETDENSNGNGSLMRIMPLLFYVKQIEDEIERYEIIREVSAITHAHVRSTLSCYYYLEFARFIVDGSSAQSAYKKANESFFSLTKTLRIDHEEMSKFDRITKGTIDKLEEADIYSDTYVIYTLEASIWSILTTNSYKDAVLKAVNLGKDTDTTAAVTGGLAGLIYTAEDIPKEWISQIAKL